MTVSRKSTSLRSQAKYKLMKSARGIFLSLNDFSFRSYEISMEIIFLCLQMPQKAFIHMSFFQYFRWEAQLVVIS